MLSPYAPKPNCFLVGAAKCGTTSLAMYLDQHPDVFLSKPKEPNFFAFVANTTPMCKGPLNSDRLYELLLKHSVTTPEKYAELFAEAGDAMAIGEASVRYLYVHQAADRIAEFAPAARIVVLLRDPVDRMYSHYHMNVLKHIEPASFSEALRLEDERVEAGWGFDWRYRRLGCYAEQVERYFDCFGRDRVLVLFHADLVHDPQSVVRQCFRHLGVADTFQPDLSKRGMVGRTPRLPWLRRLVWNDNPIKRLAKAVIPGRIRKRASRWVEEHNRGAIPTLSEIDRHELTALFANENRLLADLLGRPLPW